MRSLDVRGTLALLGSVLCWGAIPVFLKELSGHIDAWTANGVRYPMAAALFWPFLLSCRRSGALDGRLLMRALVPAALSLGGQVLWALAPYYISASLTGFLVKSSVLWALAAAMALFPDERALLSSPRFYIGLAAAFAGIAGLALSQGAFASAVTGKGVAIILGCAAFFGLYGVSVRLFLGGVHPALSFGVVAQMVSVGTIILMPIYGKPGELAGQPPWVWLLIVVSSLLGIAISHVLFYIAIGRLGASISTGVHLSGPFVTLALAQLALGETMSPKEWLAGIAMVAGGGLVLLEQQRILARRRRILLAAREAELPPVHD